jgi:alanine dehydrogenase
MPLIVTPHEAAGLLDLDRAMRVLESMMIEESDGEAFHMPPFGGSKTKRRTFRIVGGGLYGRRRMGFRSSAGTNLFDTDTGDWLAIIGGGADLRIPATMALAARYLARPDARCVGVLGSGRNPLGILKALMTVRPIEQAAVYSPKREHREMFAQRATVALGIPVAAKAAPGQATTGADIVLVATDSLTPVLTLSELRPGVHLSCMGEITELDESVYLNVDQFVVASREQEIEAASPAAHPHVEGQLYRMVREGRYDPSTMVELGSIVKGEVEARNGPADVNLFRDSRGGAGDVALANEIYERARQLGAGFELEWTV